MLYEESARTSLTMRGMATYAEMISVALRESGMRGPDDARQALALAEECGEAVGAMRRYMDMARRTGTLDHVAEELADVVITAFVSADAFGVDLPVAISRKLGVIFTRGWRDAAAIITDAPHGGSSDVESI